MHDLVIRHGQVVDGTSRPARWADVAIDGDRITAVGEVHGRGRREIDAGGLAVMPGVVDIHTHYDGQATWDPEVSPSSWHGVTTVVMGNCGVGFAPVHADRHDWLVQLMEGVEDIPGTALSEGITWRWETFPEYLDELERVFDRFYRAPGTFGEGTGLGLSIVKSILEKHGGRIRVTSAAGEGSSFVIMLPLAE